MVEFEPGQEQQQWQTAAVEKTLYRTLQRPPGTIAMAVKRYQWQEIAIELRDRLFLGQYCCPAAGVSSCTEHFGAFPWQQGPALEGVTRGWGGASGSSPVWGGAGCCFFSS
jgi:hypothetical protein